ncbi:MAG: hypothetical protein BZY80_02895 [SAR202 cluster bacterium Io17-Chloro-G2]|nr:MAG: hypothetical protein BZY80_02895 [SAR202 cluster bacterium Io17-Chloro-G2]
MPDSELGIELGTWQAAEEPVLRYLRAVGDTSDLSIQSQLAPPLALTAWALGAMLQRLDLPAGAIHSVQEMETVRGVPFGEQVTAFAGLGQPRRRGDLEFITAEYTLKAAGGEEVIRGQCTVLVNHAAAPPSVARGSAGTQASNQENLTAQTPAQPAFPVVERTITQDQLLAYSEASGDHNPLHLDPAFAATTQFGEIIAHGMLTLALVSEAMGRAYGKAWLESGALKIRFKGAAYLGDRLYTLCRPSIQQSLDQGIRQVCDVAVLEEKSGKELVTGSASVIIGNGNAGGGEERNGDL